jgi:hypothetical protein
MVLARIRSFPGSSSNVVFLLHIDRRKPVETNLARGKSVIIRVLIPNGSIRQYYTGLSLAAYCYNKNRKRSRYSKPSTDPEKVFNIYQILNFPFSNVPQKCVK